MQESYLNQYCFIYQYFFLFNLLTFGIHTQEGIYYLYNVVPIKYKLLLYYILYGRGILIFIFLLYDYHIISWLFFLWI